MRFRYCEKCGKETAHQRALGIGTLLACLITLGLWLLVIPFYPTRCRHCGAAKWAAMDSSDWWPRKDDPDYKEKATNRKIGYLALVIFIAFFFLLLMVLPRTPGYESHKNSSAPISQSFQEDYQKHFSPQK